MKRLLFHIVCIAAAAASDPGFARSQGNPLFADDEVLKAVLTAPISQTYAQKGQEVRIYFPAQWAYAEADGETQRLDVSIRTRGRFRRSYCHLPPLQLNFRKSQVKGTLFEGQDKLKLVAPCNHGERYQQYVILEYLAYRTFEILSDYSFRTRHVRLTYVDSDEKKKPWTDLVFLIEDEQDMAKRLDLDRLRVASVEYHELDHARAALVQMFQLLIGNNDYSLLQAEVGYCCHNSQLLGVRDSDTPRIPVPFDFDMSGLVNAAYATPPEQVPVIDVRDRYFYGLCMPGELQDAAIAHMRSKRDEIEALFVNSAELDRRNKAKSLEYIDEFYEILGSPARIQKEIVARCRGRALMEEMLAAPRDPT